MRSYIGSIHTEICGGAGVRGVQVTSVKTRRTQAVQVHNRDVCRWHEELCRQVMRVRAIDL